MNGVLLDKLEKVESKLDKIIRKVDGSNYCCISHLQEVDTNYYTFFVIWGRRICGRSYVYGRRQYWVDGSKPNNTLRRIHKECKTLLRMKWADGSFYSRCTADGIVR